MMRAFMMYLAEELGLVPASPNHENLDVDCRKAVLSTLAEGPADVFGFFLRRVMGARQYQTNKQAP